MWEGVTVIRSVTGGLSVGGEGSSSWGEVKWLEEVHNLAGSVTVIREV